MTNRLTIEIPESLYQRIKQRAEYKNHSIEVEAVEVMASAVPLDTDLSLDMQEAVAALQKLNDKALWKAARSHLPLKSAKKIRDLHLKRQLADLTEAEKQLLAELMHEYDKSILVRAEAAGLLIERGYDVSGLIKPKA